MLFVVVVVVLVLVDIVLVVDVVVDVVLVDVVVVFVVIVFPGHHLKRVTSLACVHSVYTAVKSDPPGFCLFVPQLVNSLSARSHRADSSRGADRACLNLSQVTPEPRPLVLDSPGSNPLPVCIQQQVHAAARHGDKRRFIALEKTAACSSRRVWDPFPQGGGRPPPLG